MDHAPLITWWRDESSQKHTDGMEPGPLLTSQSWDQGISLSSSLVHCPQKPAHYMLGKLLSISHKSPAHPTLPRALRRKAAPGRLVSPGRARMKLLPAAEAGDRTGPGNRCLRGNEDASCGQSSPTHGRLSTYSRLIPDSGWGDSLRWAAGGGGGIRFSSSISSLERIERY